MKETENIFEGAKFGEHFKTQNNKKVVFLDYSYSKRCAKEELEYSDSRYGISDKHDLENAFEAGFKAVHRKAKGE